MASTIEKITIALPPEMLSDLRSAVDSGEYASTSEAIRDALRDWRQRRQLQQGSVAELRKLWREARADFRPGLQADTVFAELERRIRARVR